MLSFNVLKNLFLRGLVGLLVWEFYVNYISPLFGIDLRPRQLAMNLFGTTNPVVGQALHLLVALFLYPLLGYFLSQLMTGYSWIYRAIALGLLTWFLALGILTPLARGAFMANWSNLTWSSLVGHLFYALAVLGPMPLPFPSE